MSSFDEGYRDELDELCFSQEQRDRMSWRLRAAEKDRCRTRRPDKRRGFCPEPKGASLVWRDLARVASVLLVASTVGLVARSLAQRLLL